MASSTIAPGASIHWRPEYELGLAQVDQQHKALFHLLGEAWQALVRNDREKTLLLIRRLEHYTVVHFAEEEAYMRSIGYVGIDTHKKQHDAFVRRIAQEAAGIASGADISLNLFHFLRDWLLQHILVDDRKYAEFEARQSRPSNPLASFFRLFRA